MVNNDTPMTEGIEAKIRAAKSQDLLQRVEEFTASAPIADVLLLVEVFDVWDPNFSDRPLGIAMAFDQVQKPQF